MSNIKRAFENGKAFIAFITCGDPDLETTKKTVIEMAAKNKWMSESHDQLLGEAFSAMMCSVYISINLFKYCGRNDKKMVLMCIKQNRWIFDYTPSIKYKMFIIKSVNLPLLYIHFLKVAVTKLSLVVAIFLCKNVSRETLEKR